MENKIVLKSSAAGMLPYLLTNFLLCALFYKAISAANAIGVWLGDGPSDLSTIDVMANAIAYFFISTYVLRMLRIIFYRSRTRIEFELNAEGKITKIMKTSYSFLSSKTEKESVCNRILGIDIYIPTTGSWVNAGAITINFVAFANANIEDKTWSIKGVEDPLELKQQIITASPEHTGLQITGTN